MSFNKLFHLSTSKSFLLPRNLRVISRDFVGMAHRVMEGKLNIPPRPKRPLNPFMKFLLLERPQIKNEYPNAKITELTTIIGNKWSTCDQSLKMELQEQYKKEMINYSREIMEYERLLTDEQKIRMKEENHKIQKTKKKNKMRSKLAELGKPKKPPTAFIMYMLSKIATKSSDIQFSSWLIDVSKEWTGLPPEDRVKYEIEAKKLMEQYKNDMIQWESKMIRLGHLDVVRGQVLLDLKDKRTKE